MTVANQGRQQPGEFPERIMRVDPTHDTTVISDIYALAERADFDDVDFEQPIYVRRSSTLRLQGGP